MLHTSYNELVSALEQLISNLEASAESAEQDHARSIIAEKILRKKVDDVNKLLDIANLDYVRLEEMWDNQKTALHQAQDAFYLPELDGQTR